MPCAWPASSFQSPQRSRIWPRRSSSAIVCGGKRPRCAACRAPRPARSGPRASAALRAPPGCCGRSRSWRRRPAAWICGWPSAPMQPSTPQSLPSRKRERGDQRVQRRLARRDASSGAPGRARNRRRGSAARRRYSPATTQEPNTPYRLWISDGGVAVGVDRGDEDGVAVQAAVGRDPVPGQRARGVDQRASLVRMGFRDQPLDRHVRRSAGRRGSGRDRGRRSAWPAPSDARGRRPRRACGAVRAARAG